MGNQTPVSGYHASAITIQELADIYEDSRIPNPVSGDNLKVHNP